MPPRMGRVAYAVLHGDPPDVYIAEDDEVLSRLIALEVVAATPSSEFHDPEQLSRIRSALLDENWAGAVAEWIENSGIVIDAYPDEQIWIHAQLDDERTAFEIRVAPIFRD